MTVLPDDPTTALIQLARSKRRPHDTFGVISLVYKILKEAPLSINKQRRADGRTALMVAAQAHHSDDIVMSLVQAGADTLKTDKMGKTALDLALAGGQKTLGAAKILKKANEEMQNRLAQGNTLKVRPSAQRTRNPNTRPVLFRLSVIATMLVCLFPNGGRVVPSMNLYFDNPFFVSFGACRFQSTDGCL